MSSNLPQICQMYEGYRKQSLVHRILICVHNNIGQDCPNIIFYVLSIEWTLRLCGYRVAKGPATAFCPVSILHVLFLMYI